MHRIFRTLLLLSLLILSVGQILLPHQPERATLACAHGGCGKLSPMANAPPAFTPVYTYTVVNIYPHDRTAFTQGLIYEEGFLYESTGLRGRSTLRKVKLETGNILQRRDLSPSYFGEGITVYDNKVIQLTWQSRVGFVYDKDSFEQLQEFTYPTEGWGITHDDTRLIMSDGTATLYFWGPDTLEEIGQIDVYDDAGPVIRLNELEYIRGEIYANIWQTDRIARIDPRTGQVLGWINLTGLLSAADRNPPVDVLNGIAYDAENDRLFVTGKLWPKLFEIKPAYYIYLPLILKKFRHPSFGANAPRSNALHPRTYRNFNQVRQTKSFAAQEHFN